MHLYIHVPFCARRCSYCDFAIAVRRVTPTGAFVAAILREWEGWQAHTAWTAAPTVETIYFGGGTPSRLDPDGLEAILRGIRERRVVAPGAEVTLEANPDDVTAERTQRWRAIGINRISLGAQSFHPAVLTWMHRTHTADDVPRAMGNLRHAGFDNISIDLIFGLAAEHRRNWREDLDRALALEPQHLSLYGLTVESHTPLGHWVAAGRARPAEEALYAEEFLEAHDLLSTAGYQHYEVSNYGRAGRRAEHNSAYWRRRPFIGLGPSAHSGFDRQRQWNLREWAAYQRAVAAGQDPTAARETLSPQAVVLEDLYLGLRTAEGIPAASLPAQTPDLWARVGWATNRNGRVVLTPEGWLRLDALVSSVSSKQ